MRAILACLLQGVVLVVCLNMVTAEPAPLTQHELSILLEEPEEDTEINDPVLPSFGTVGTVIHAVKAQFRGIIEEIIFHALKYIISTFHQMKINLLKRLGRYTLSDVFHAVFDGVTDFVIEASPSEPLYERNKQVSHKTLVKPLPYSMPTYYG